MKTKLVRNLILCGSGLLVLFAVLAFAWPVGTGDVPELKQNYPNPFSGSTEIEYHVPKGHVLLRVFNTIGQEIQVLVNEVQEGDRRARFEGSNFPSGQYTYTLVFTADDDGTVTKLSKKMYLVR